MQINRLFEIVYLLLEREKVTADTLAQRFEVSRRTIYRDIETLSEAGIPVYMARGNGGGVALLPGFVLNKTMLTEQEKAEMLSALQAVKELAPGEGGAALHKLSSLLGSGGENWIEVDFSAWGNGEQEATIFAELKAAILHKRVIHFQYFGSNGQSMPRVVEPLKLCFKGQGWYLYAFCRERKDVRFFKLSRIRELKATEEGFERVGPAAVLASQPAYQGKSVTLQLKLSQAAAYRVYDEFKEYSQLEDGSFLVKVSMPCGDWLYQYLMTYAEHAEVLGPAEIRLEMEQRLEKTLARYRQI